MNDLLFSERIRNIREMKGYNQTDVALLIGKSQSYYSKLESNPSRFRLAEIEQVAQALGLSLAELLDDGKRWENMIQIAKVLSDQWRMYAQNLKDEIQSEKKWINQERISFQKSEKQLRLKLEQEYEERKLTIKEVQQLRTKNYEQRNQLIEKSNQLNEASGSFRELKSSARAAIDFLDEIKRSITIDSIKKFVLKINPEREIDYNHLNFLSEELKKIIKGAKEKALKEFNSVNFPKTD